MTILNSTNQSYTSKMSAPNVMDLPAMKPPWNVIANYENPSNENSMALAIISTCLAVSTMAVLLRIFSRGVVLRKFEVQDTLLLTAHTIYVSTLVLYIRLSWNPGWFIHQWDLHMRDVVEFLRISIISTCLFVSFLILMKTAILVEWIRVFLPNSGNRNRVFFFTCHVTIWANITFCTIMLILVNLSCVPHEYLWNRTIKGGYCRINTAYTSLSTACFVFATDIIILFIPQRIIWTLNMSRRRKVGVSVVFTLGVAACAASIVRLYWTVRRSQSADLTYHLSTVQITTVAEGTCLILVLCVPTFPKALGGMKLERLKNLPTRLFRRPGEKRENHASSQQSFAHASPGVEAAKTAHKNGNHGGYSLEQSGSSSERFLVPLQQLPNAFHTKSGPGMGPDIREGNNYQLKSGHDDLRHQHSNLQGTGVTPAWHYTTGRGGGV